MRRACLNTAAVLLMGIGPLLAANNATLVGVPHTSQPGAIPGAVSQGFLATAVIAGLTDPQGIVPCFNCVTGPDIGTLLMAVPQQAFHTGESITIMVIGDDLFYAGNAAFTYSIKASPDAMPVSTGTVGGAVTPSVWFAQFPITAPAPGAYILEGEISQGAGFSQHVKVVSKLLVGQ